VRRGRVVAPARRNGTTNAIRLHREEQRLFPADLPPPGRRKVTMKVPRGGRIRLDWPLRWLVRFFIVDVVRDACCSGAKHELAAGREHFSLTRWTFSVFSRRRDCWQSPGMRYFADRYGLVATMNRRVNILGVMVSAINMADALSTFRRWIHDRSPERPRLGRPRSRRRC